MSGAQSWPLLLKLTLKTDVMLKQKSIDSTVPTYVNICQHRNSNYIVDHMLHSLGNVLLNKFEAIPRFVTHTLVSISVYCLSCINGSQDNVI